MPVLKTGDGVTYPRVQIRPLRQTAVDVGLERVEHTHAHFVSRTDSHFTHQPLQIDFERIALSAVCCVNRIQSKFEVPSRSLVCCRRQPFFDHKRQLFFPSRVYSDSHSYPQPNSVQRLGVWHSPSGR